MKPEEIAKFDQAAKELADSLPLLLKGLYDSCMYEGFTECQSMEIVKTFIVSFLNK